MAEILDALDMAERLYQVRDHRHRIKQDWVKLKRRGHDMLLQEEVAQEHPIQAQIDWGRWIAKCECGGAEYVTREDPVFYCFSCGNHISGGMLRPVQFPSKKTEKKIVALLMERPQDMSRGTDKFSRALKANPQVVRDPETGRVHVLSRSWDPGETVKDLEAQNRHLKKREVSDG